PLGDLAENFHLVLIAGVASPCPLPPVSARWQRPKGVFMEAQTAAPASPIRTGKEMRWEDWTAYGFLLAGIYFLVGTLFFYAGKEKIFDGLGAPKGIKEQFAGTFLDTIPGTDAAWTILGILEFAIFVI